MGDGRGWRTLLLDVFTPGRVCFIVLLARLPTRECLVAPGVGTMLHLFFLLVGWLCFLVYDVMRWFFRHRGVDTCGFDWKALTNDDAFGVCFCGLLLMAKLNWVLE